MSWQFPQGLWPLLAAAVLSFATTIRAWRFRDRPAAPALVAMLLAVGVWCLGYALQLASVPLDTKLFWTRFQYLGIVSVPTMWLLFALRYGHLLEGRSWRLSWLALEPLAILVLVWTHDGQDAYWLAVGVRQIGDFRVLTVDHGALFWIHVGYSYLLLLAGTSLLMQQVIHACKAHRAQLLLLLIGCLAPWVANIAYLTGTGPFPHLDLTPMGFLFSGMVITWAMFHRHLLDLAPVNRHLVVEHMRDGVVVLDLQRRIADINRAAREILAEHEDVVGRTIDEVLPEWRDGDADGSTEDELILDRPGGLTCFAVTRTSIGDASDHPTGTLMVLHDVTERWRAEAGQRAVEEIRDQIALMRGSHDIEGILALVGKSLKAVGVPFTYYGINLVDKRVEGLHFAIHALDREGQVVETPQEGIASDLLAETWRTGKPQYRRRIQQQDDFGELQLLNDAFSVPIQSAVDIPFSHGTLAASSTEPDAFSEKDLDFLIHLARVMSEGYRRMEDLRRLEEQNRRLSKEMEERRQAVSELVKLSQAVQHSPVSVVITDRQGTIEYVNPFFTRITGYTEKEAIGANPRVLSAGEHSPTFYKRLWDKILAGKVWDGTFANRKKSGEKYWERARIAPIYHESGEITHFVAIKEDITAEIRTRTELRRAKTAAEEANRAKSDFLTSMSHELRTPLQTIVGMTELALGTSLDETQRHYLESVQSSSTALEKLIRDILDFSRMEADQLELEHVRFPLHLRLQQVVESLSTQAQKRGLALSYRIGEGVPAWVTGDWFRLWQVLMNLLDNALKFTHRGGVDMEVVLEERRGESAFLHFKIQDTGIGVEPAHQQRIFTAFSQADSSFARRYGGTGLGLSICARLVKLMKGRIWLESEIGKGSTFHFIVSVAIADDQGTEQTAAVSAAPPATPQSAPLPSLRILAVEDTLANQRLIETVLRKRGHEVRVANSGGAALEILSQHHFDLVLMDTWLPDMDGAEASRRIRELQAHEPRLPIVVLSSQDEWGAASRGDGAEVDGVLAKPIRPSQLLEMVEHWAHALPGKGEPDAGKKGDAFPPGAEMYRQGTGSGDGEDSFLSREEALAQVEGDEELLADMVDTILGECPASLQAIRAAVKEEEPEAVAKTAHALKSVVGLLGDNAAFQAAARLEGLGRDGDLSLVSTALAELETQIERFTRALTELVNA